MLNRANTTLPSFIGALLLLSLVVVTFLQVRSFEFLNFDDPEYVINNPFVNSGLSYANIRRAFVETHGAHWHPLSWISHMVDCELFGLQPGPHHLVNVGFHCASVLLLFTLLLRVSPYSGAAAFAYSFFIAALFGIHPLRIESVAWVSERKDVLSVFFALLAFHAYCSFVRNRSWCWYGATFAFLALGLLAKPMLVSLPVLLLLLDYWPLNRTPLSRSDSEHLSWTRLVVEKVPLFALALASSATALLAQRAGGGLRTLSEASIADRFTTAFAGILGYAGKFFWPSAMGIFYPYIDLPEVRLIGVEAG